MENTENQEIQLDFDFLVMEFQKENKSIGAISISKTDLDTLSNMHGIGVKDIAADMAYQLMESIRNGNVTSEREN